MVLFVFEIFDDSQFESIQFQSSSLDEEQQLKISQ